MRQKNAPRSSGTPQCHGRNASSASFNIDIETCVECGGAVKVIACIEDPVVIKKIRTHLNEKAASAEPAQLPESRAPPVYVPGTDRQADLFG